MPTLHKLAEWELAVSKSIAAKSFILFLGCCGCVCCLLVVLVVGVVVLILRNIVDEVGIVARFRNALPRP
jgi:hypothetical protein